MKNQLSRTSIHPRDSASRHSEGRIGGAFIDYSLSDKLCGRHVAFSAQVKQSLEFGAGCGSFEYGLLSHVGISEEKDEPKDTRVKKQSQNQGLTFLSVSSANLRHSGVQSMNPCGTCRHFELTMPTTRFGTCATGAWVRSYVPGTGYYLTPHESIGRECNKYENAQ